MQRRKQALRSMERGLLATDALWVRQTFGQVAWPLRRAWVVLCWTLTAAAAALVVCGIVLPGLLPLALPGFLLAGVAICCHTARRNRLHPPARRGAGPGEGFRCHPS
ncbi:DUF3040 domain-containing protein [Amycolatopsis jejuensis]|uniref:DUF3040 domain-containing protein n=1 Tax=Amycolatopsis jejuensis TaxID=330084 RepID=UPI000523FBE0|nr:DUF3040 domain-containing protein [Amycolatopsis jejuensis]